MLQELYDESGKQGLKMNKSKTKVAMESGTPIYVNNTQIENVESNIYLGQIYSTRDKNQDMEMHIIWDGWTVFAHHCDIFNSCILPAMLYRVETYIGTHQPGKEQASSHTYKDGKEYFIHYIPGQKNKHLRKRKNKGYKRFDQDRRRNGLG